MLRVKICGITNSEDAYAAVQYGTDALGFVFYTKSPRSVSPETVKAIISGIPPFVTTVGVFVNKEMKDIENIASFTGLDVIQLHGSEPPEYCKSDKKMVKAFRVKDMSDLDSIKKYETVSAILLDTYSPDHYGGTGQVFNWEIAVEAKKYHPVILAGGLTVDNVISAVQTVQPFAIDVSSGVESSTKGKKDHGKIKTFIERAKSQP